MGATIVFLLGFSASAWAATDIVMNANDSGSGSLREVIAEAGSGDTIAFDAGLEGQTISLTTGAIGIGKSLTIEGLGATHLTIDAGHNSQIFTISEGDISVSGLRITNGAAFEDGGAISNEGAGSLTVSECTFTGNTAGGPGGSGEKSNLGHGGAIYVSRSSAPTSVSDSTFSANAAGGPGGTGFQSGLGSGGAIWDGAEGSLTVSGSTFAGNTAGGNGDGGEQGGNGAGGAIQKSGGLSLIVSESEFTGNTAGGDGGSEKNSGHGVGGAIYVSQLFATPTSLSVSDSGFIGNAAGGVGGEGEGSGRGEGGAIEHFSEGSLSISGSTFEANGAGGTGGAGGPLFAQGGSGAGQGGAIIVDESASSTSISDSAFIANIAGGDGGSGNLSGRGEGGAIKGASGIGPLTVTASTFTDNVAGGRKGSGGGSGAAVGGAIESFGSLTVTDSTFLGNAAAGQGGAGEGAFGFGGAIRNFNNVSPLTVSGSTFVGNTAGGQGGAGNGGAIRVSSISARSTSISNSTLVGNAAGGGGAVGHGGALEVDGKVSTTLASVTIDENEVGAGGAGAAIAGAGEVTAKATIVAGNTGATNCDAPVGSRSYSLEGPSAGETSCGFDLGSADPQLEPLADNGGPTETQALPPSSPAVDAVPVAKCPTKIDQRGEPRPDNGKSVCDIGAFELQDPPVAPAITSAAATTFQAGKAGSFIVAATGLPLPALAENGALPAGIAFTDNGDGTASLAGTPAMESGGAYLVTIRASNGTLPDAEQAFELTVQAPPTASIAAPTAGATYTQGETISTGFTCSEGAGGPGVDSCVDQDGRGSGAPLDTSSLGPHTLTVVATSGDGLTGSASASYTVVAPSKIPPPVHRHRRLLLSYRQVGGIGAPRPMLRIFRSHQARLKLGRCVAELALHQASWRRLHAALRKAHLHAIAGSYPAPRGSADLATHVIRARGEVVRIALPQPGHRYVIRHLRPLLKLLGRMVSAGKRRMPSSCLSSWRNHGHHHRAHRATAK